MLQMIRVSAVGWLCLLSAALGDQADVMMLDQRPAATNAPAPIVYWHETRTAPRPLQMHFLQVDLRAKSIETTALVADDPDSDGPAEAELERPLPLATRLHALAAVNANAFGQVAKLKEGEKPHWTDKLPVFICGWALTPSRLASPPQQGYANFWIEPNGRGRVGELAEAVKARTAVAGFGPLLLDGKNVVGQEKPLHPRTAVGVDRDGSTMFLAVVDGRQPGTSEGMTTFELAELMKEIGCWNAINLDGGGSSVMLLATDGEKLKIMNRPSDFGTRPVPVMLGVRKRP